MVVTSLQILSLEPIQESAPWMCALWELQSDFIQDRVQTLGHICKHKRVSVWLLLYFCRETWDWQ